MPVASIPLALAVLGRGLVDPSHPVLNADDGAVLRGRAAFETMRVYDLRPFRLADHLVRLQNSCRILQLPEPDVGALEELAAVAVDGAGAAQAALRIVWTPGPDDGNPVGFALVTAIPEGLEEERARGIGLVALGLAIGAAARQASPWLLPGVKSTSYAVNIAAQEEARRRGADDAVFVSLEGTVLEGPVSNVWMVHDGLVRTPSLDLGILAGVTRETLLAAAAAQGLDVEQGAYPVELLHSADEIFTSSSVREVMPVVRMDGQAVGDGRPGPVAARMQQAVRAAAVA